MTTNSFSERTLGTKGMSINLFSAGDIVGVLVVSKSDETRESKTDSFLALKTLSRLVDAAKRKDELDSLLQ
jgi:hypothetical protein